MEMAKRSGGELAIQLDGGEDWFGTLQTSNKMNRAKINHDKGVFVIPGEDGFDEEHEELHDLVAVEVRSGRLMWDPNAEIGSGTRLCGSDNGIQPDANGAYAGPCAACPNSQWGPKVNGKSTPPACQETASIYVMRVDGPGFIFTGSKSSLRPVRDFFNNNFRRVGRPPFVRFFSMKLVEQKKGSRVYYIPELILGDVVPAETQEQAYDLYKAIKAGSFDLGGGNASDEAEPAPAPVVEPVPVAKPAARRPIYRQ